MDRQDIIARLRENEATLRARGVAHAALFGSRAGRPGRPGRGIASRDWPQLQRQRSDDFEAGGVMRIAR
jgi:hypothetical protein